MLFEFRNISYNLGVKSERKIKLSGAADSGQVLVIRGPSGVGKTTLLRVLARLQPCASGEAFLQGNSWNKILANAWRAKVHYLTQKPTFLDGTVKDNLTTPFNLRILKGDKQLNETMSKKLINALLLPHGIWEQDARTLSGGETQRVAFIRTLLTEPTVLLLDEPTSALDEKARSAFYQLLQWWVNDKPGRTALLISHNNDFNILENISFLDILPSEEVV